MGDLLLPYWKIRPRVLQPGQDKYMTRGSKVRALAWAISLAVVGSVTAYLLLGGPWAIAGIALGAVTGSFAPSVYDGIRRRDTEREHWQASFAKAPRRSPARLLDPRLELVSFIGREIELAKLMAWHEDEKATPYLCKLPDHVLKRMQRAFSVGGALQEFADARAVPPRDILRVGLTILSALAELCKSDSPSILRRAA
jgi:hypothetical protein